MADLPEVFKKAGVPTHTFVAPVEYDRVYVALKTPGRAVIVEGPSGIGKTSCVKRALESTGFADSCLFLSARKGDDSGIIRELPRMKGVGVVVIDDFHRLPDSIKQEITDFVKTLADEEDESSKVILIGINKAGETLIEYAPDLLHRVEVIRFGRTNVERLRSLIELGERALNCSIAVADEISAEAEGSFAMVQVLCHEACLQAKVLKTVEGDSAQLVDASLPSVREAVLADLGTRFFPIAREFATGNKLRREGRAPYLHMLRWLAETQEGVLDTKEALASNPNLRGSVGQVLEKGHLSTLIRGSKHIADLFHFEPATGLLTLEDPKLLYYIRHIIWSKFARQVGYHSIDFASRIDFALSFAGEDRELASALDAALRVREIEVFYDKNEQSRILANDVEEYLAPIYRSESSYVVALISKHYPKKLWTKFESDNFKQRFGNGSVIPIWFADNYPGLFDATRTIGGLSFDPARSLPDQVEEIADVLASRLMVDRESEAKDDQSRPAANDELPF